MNVIGEQGQRQFDITGSADSTLQDLATEANNLHQQCEETARTAIDFALRCGDSLAMAKEVVPHGQWEAWLTANCPTISMRTAQGYMRLAANRANIEEAKAKPASHLTIKGALKLLSDSRPETDPQDVLSLSGPLPAIGQTLYGKYCLDEEIVIVEIEYPDNRGVNLSIHHLVGEESYTDSTRGLIHPKWVHPSIKLMWDEYSPDQMRWAISKGEVA